MERTVTPEETTLLLEDNGLRNECDEVCGVANALNVYVRDATHVTPSRQRQRSRAPIMAPGSILPYSSDAVLAAVNLEEQRHEDE
jgi:hypothetical protein